MEIIPVSSFESQTEVNKTVNVATVGGNYMAGFCHQSIRLFDLPVLSFNLAVGPCDHASP